MSPYRSDTDAAFYMNEHLEKDIKQLMAENAELRRKNASLEVIAKGLLCGPDHQRQKRGDTADRIVEMSREMSEFIQQTQFRLRLTTVCLVVAVASAYAGHLLW